MFERFDRTARAAVVIAFELARSAGTSASVEHLLIGVYRAGGVGSAVLASYGVTENDLRRDAPGGPARQAGLTDAEVAALRAVGVDADEIVRRAHEAFGPAPVRPSQRTRVDEAGIQLLRQAKHESKALRHKHIGTEHLLLAVLATQRELIGHGATYDDARQRVLQERRRAS